MPKAIFIDRDGVLNALVYHQEQEVIDSPFTVNQFRLMPAVPEAIKLIHRAGYLAVVISNQPGIAKGHMTEDAFDRIKQKMGSELSQNGAALDAEYYCLHHPQALVEKYQVSCDCRKPRPGLILQAARELNIDLPRSWMIGDNLSDIQAGQSSGCRTILLGKMKCETCCLMAERQVRPDHIFENLISACQYLSSNP